MASKLNTPVTGGSPSPVGSLTASSNTLPQDADWTAFGVEHDPQACLNAWVWQQCSQADEENPKPLNDGVDAVRFLPFLLEANSSSCDGLPGDHELHEDRARNILRWNASQQVARAISASSPDINPNLNPNFTDTAQDITPVLGPAGLVNTVSGLLQDAVACGLNGDLFIHAPHWTLPHWLEKQLITQVGSTFRMGSHTVVLDQGYTNDEPAGADPADVGEAWIYVTSPVEYATGPVQILRDTTRGITLRENRANVIAAQLAIYRFDACCVKAAKAKVC